MNTDDKNQPIKAEISFEISDDGKPERPTKFERNKKRAARSGMVLLVSLFCVWLFLTIGFPYIAGIAAVVAFVSAVVASYFLDCAIFSSDSTWTPIDGF